MMRISWGIGLMLAMTFASPAAVIDFEDLTGQAFLPADYAGLTWTSGWEYYDWSQPPYNPSSGVVRVYNNGGLPPVGFSFSSPVVFTGAYFSGEYAAQYELWLNGNLVATSPLISISAIHTFLASGYGGLVDEVRLTGITQGQFVMDDVTYSGSAIPEPATLTFIALGMAGLFALRRRSA